ncbi:hypothetical protein ABIE24_002118 [Mycetocola sp. 2940]
MQCVPDEQLAALLVPFAARTWRVNEVCAPPRAAKAVQFIHESRRTIERYAPPKVERAPSRCNPAVYLRKPAIPAACMNDQECSSGDRRPSSSLCPTCPSSTPISQPPVAIQNRGRSILTGPEKAAVGRRPTRSRRRSLSTGPRQRRREPTGPGQGIRPRPGIHRTVTRCVRRRRRECQFPLQSSTRCSERTERRQRSPPAERLWACPLP